jgi:hypothetical protein
MDITTYLPDELGARAKAAGVKFSALLRDAVTMDLVQREAFETLTEQMQVHELVAITDDAGNTYDAQLYGVALAHNDVSDATAYALEDGGLAVHVIEDSRTTDYNRLYMYGQGGYDTSQSEWLSQWFSTEQVIQIMKKLGKRAVIKIGRREA